MGWFHHLFEFHQEKMNYLILLQYLKYNFYKNFIKKIFLKKKKKNIYIYIYIIHLYLNIYL